MQPTFDINPSSPQNMASGHSQVIDMSSANLGAAMPGMNSAGGVLVKFFYARIQIQSKNAEKNGTYETRLCVAKQPKADRDTVAAVFITKEEAKRQFPREYEYFTKNEDLPTTGTPLAELPGITLSQLGLLNLNGLRSIEDLAEIDHDQASAIHFDVVRCHKQAQRWVANKADGLQEIDLATIETNYQQEIKARDAREAQMAAQIKEMQIQLDALRNVGTGQNAQAQTQEVAPAREIAGEDLPGLGEDMPNPMAEGNGVVELDDPLA